MIYERSRHLFAHDARWGQEYVLFIWYWCLSSITLLIYDENVVMVSSVLIVLVKGS